MYPGQASLCAKCHLDPSSRLATMDMGRKLGRRTPPPFRGGESCSLHLTQSRLGRVLPPYQVASCKIHPVIWPQQIWAENWGLRPFGGVGAGSPCNTIWPGPRPTCMPCRFHLDPSNHLATIHQRHRRDRTDMTDRQGPDSIGRTVLQTVAQKPSLKIKFKRQLYSSK